MALGHSEPPAAATERFAHLNEQLPGRSLAVAIICIRLRIF